MQLTAQTLALLLLSFLIAPMSLQASDAISRENAHKAIAETQNDLDQLERNIERLEKINASLSDDLAALNARIRAITPTVCGETAKLKWSGQQYACIPDRKL